MQCIAEFGIVEQIEECDAFKGAYEISFLLEKYDDTFYKYKNLAILNITMKTMDTMITSMNFLRLYMFS